MNGVPLIEALRTVRDAVGNLAASRAIEGATTSARGGIDLSRSLEEPNIFPKRTIYLLRLGEETAQLGQMALHAAEIHEKATRISVQRLLALLVPAITIAMGAMNCRHCHLARAATQRHARFARCCANRCCQSAGRPRRSDRAKP